MSKSICIPQIGSYGNNEETETCLEIIEKGRSLHCWRMSDEQFLRVFTGHDDGYISYEIDTAQRTVDSVSELLDSPPTLAQINALKLRP